MRSAHLIISGRVQGVGYRAWLAEEARARALNGWVRNRQDGTVEAVLAGPSDPLNALISACGTGPAEAEVARVDVSDWQETLPFGFKVLPTA